MNAYPMNHDPSCPAGSSRRTSPAATSRFRICPSACSGALAAASRFAAASPSAIRSWISAPPPHAGHSKVPHVESRRARHSVLAQRTDGRRPAAQGALRLALSRALRADRRARSAAIGAGAAGEPRPCVAGAHRRLHRLLLLHPPCDRRRAAVPPGPAADAQLPLAADRLSRPQLLAGGVAAIVPAADGAEAAAGRRAAAVRPQPAARLRARAGRIHRPRQRARHPDRHGRRGGAHLRPRACSTTGRRATCRPGSTSRSVRFSARTSPPRFRRGSSPSRRWHPIACPGAGAADDPAAAGLSATATAALRRGRLRHRARSADADRAMRSAGQPPARLSPSSFRHAYWTLAQHDRASHRQRLQPAQRRSARHRHAIGARAGARPARCWS